MMDKILCGYRDDSRLWDQSETTADKHAAAVESHTEDMIEECKSLDYIKQLERDWELSETDLLENLIQAVATWTGRSDDAARCMRKLHNLLADEFQKIAEREVKS